MLSLQCHEAVKKQMQLLFLGAFVRDVPSKQKENSDSTRSRINFVFFHELSPVEKEAGNKFDAILDKFIKISRDYKEKDALQFWKQHQIVFPELAKLEKILECTSLAVERMFSITGHIFSVKRRRLSVNY